MNSFNFNKLLQIFIVTFLFPLTVGSTVFFLVTQPDTKNNEVQPSLTPSTTPIDASCKVPNIVTSDTTIDYASVGNNLQKLLNILPAEKGAYMGVYSKKGIVYFEKYYGNSSTKIGMDFCANSVFPVGNPNVMIYIGPNVPLSQSLPMEQLNLVGIFEGRKMFFNVPPNSNVYVTTPNDLIDNKY